MLRGMIGMMYRFGAIISLIALVGCSEKDIDFNAQVKPILNKHCISCHGGVKKNAGFSVLFAEEILKPTESGEPAIIPGDAKNSPFIKRLHEKDPELRMPYQKEPLSKEDIQILTQWIDQGAKWGTHWAYEVPEKSNPPIFEESLFERQDEFLQNPIDHFVLAQMQQHNLFPNPKANKISLARRVALDLTGLPPSKKWLQNFQEGFMTYEQLVDSLLQSNAYGEKWASWWLDLARYADSKGYEKDSGRSIWQYRDWVIDALNQDLPFDQFTIDQLAGDLLPNPTPEQFIATGFHRNTMNNDEGGTSDEEFRTAAVIDRINTTFSVWQSTTMECVQCHSHPYDPFKHEEYYQLLAYFNNTRDEDTPDEAPNYRNYSPADAEKVAEVLQWIATYGDASQQKQFKDFLYFLEPKYQLHHCENFTNGAMADGKWLALWDNGSAYLRNVDAQRANRLYFNYFSRQNGTVITIRENNAKGAVLAQLKIDKHNGQIGQVAFKAPLTKTDLYIEAQNDALAPQTTTSFFSWFAFLPELPGKNQKGYVNIKRIWNELLNAKVEKSPVMIENPPFMKRTTQLFERGNWQIKTDTVKPQTPKALNPWKKEWKNNRLGLAQWLVSKENPLTARTVVNRIWHQLFGNGLVSPIEDIGSQSEPPTHPLLLDWLAVDFMNTHQWQLKSLIRTIVLSGTYQQSASLTEDKKLYDPNNIWYARGPKMRLKAEQVRDQALYISGLLSRKMGGPGVMPPQPKGIWAHVYLGDLWVESKGEDRYRRALYTYFKRTSPYPSFITFDAGSREVCLVNRMPTNTPLQALVTLNDPVYLEAAMALAKQVAQENDSETAIAKMYEKALYYNPQEEKLEPLVLLYQKALTSFKENPQALQSFLDQKEPTTEHLAALTIVANAIMNLDEFLTQS